MSIANMLVDKGCNVFFLTKHKDDFDHAIFKEYYPHQGVFFVRHPENCKFTEYSPSGGIVSASTLSYALEVEKVFDTIISEVSPNLVFSADYGAEALFLLLRKFQGEYQNVRFVLHLSGALQEMLEVYEGGGGDSCKFSEFFEPRSKLVCAMEDACMLLSDTVITPSVVAWEKIKDRLLINSKNVHVIPNFPSEQFRLSANDQDGSVKQKEKIVLFIGRLDRLKGADILLKIFIQYLDRFCSDAKLVMIGRDCFWKSYNQTFLKEWENRIPKQYRDQIVFTGQVDHSEVVEYFRMANVCVFPSRWEVFGLVCLEAMSHGVPALVSRGTGLEEILGSELKSFVFDFSIEQNEVLEALHTHLEDPSSKEALVEIVRNRAKDVIAHGRTGYDRLLDIAPSANKQNDVSELVLGNLKTSLEAVCNITGFLGNDLDRMKSHFGISEQEFKEIVQGTKGSSRSLISRFRDFF